MHAQTIFVAIIAFGALISHNEAQNFARYQRLAIHERDLRPMDMKEYENCPHKICTKVSHYPYDIIERLISNETVINYTLGRIFEADFLKGYRVEDRWGDYDPSEGDSLCKNDGPSISAPLVLRNHHDQWKYVVNIKGHPQYFSSGYCMKDSMCNTLKNSRCVQRTHEIPMLTYENGQLQYDRFIVPTNCECISCGR